MLAVEIRHHRQHWRQLQKRAVALIRLRNQILRRPQPRIRSQRIHAPAHHYCRVEIPLATARAQNCRNHCRRRRLAMHAGHGDPVFQPHQLRQHLRALNHRDFPRPRFHHFRVCGRDSRTRHDHIAGRRVPGRVPLVDHRAHARQPVRRRRPPQVRPRHRIPHRQQDLRDPAHANPANADEVDTVRRSK